MSPILKRDVAETVRQARRLAAAAGLTDYDEYAEYELDPVGVSRAARTQRAGARDGARQRRDSVASAGEPNANGYARREAWAERRATPMDIARIRDEERGLRREPQWETRDQIALRGLGETVHIGGSDSAPLLDGGSDSTGDETTMSAIEGKWSDLRGLLFSSTPSLLFALVGLVFSGQLLEHCARWRVFRRVDELFILVPMIGNLKGNLEMCLSARLGTSATLGELDSRRVRRGLLTANMTLLGLQALLISSLAAVISFLLGLITTHRLGDVPANDPTGRLNGTLSSLPPGTVADPSVTDPWREGNTRPGGAQLVMVLATSMGAAGLSALVLGGFMCSLVVCCRWHNVDPDNITPPVAACLGDLVTLFVLALIGTMLVGAMDTVGPLIGVLALSAAAIWFTRRVMRDRWVKDIARGSWVPLISAMLISSGTGMVLERGVDKYRGFALLAISMTGLTGSIGAIHANRLSTQLHRGLHPTSKGAAWHGLSPVQSMSVLFALSFPCQGIFLLFVNATGWIDVSLSWAGWLTYAVTTAFSLCSAHLFTLFCWQRNLDPDSYTLPIHSAVVDFIGQLLLMLAYELCRLSGGDVMSSAR